ncbi:hypothetical protein KC867_03240 [Candidatus Saccharibacteria bacterium]|nr:hypothetical protein [Candidatus Saccharibacteria bacterium]
MLTVVLCAFPIYWEVKIQFINAKATAMTRLVVGNNDVYARCQRDVADMFQMNNMSYAGWVEYSSPTKSNLTPWTCSQFRSWVTSDKKHATDHQIRSFHIVLHEAVHLTGEYNEAMAEYKASKIFQDIAISMGVSPTEALRMYTFHRERINPNMPMQYRVDFEEKEREEQEAKEAEEAKAREQAEEQNDTTETPEQQPAQ